MFAKGFAQDKYGFCPCPWLSWTLSCLPKQNPWANPSFSWIAAGHSLALLDHDKAHTRAMATLHGLDWLFAVGIIFFLVSLWGIGANDVSLAVPSRVSRLRGPGHTNTSTLS